MRPLRDEVSAGPTVEPAGGAAEGETNEFDRFFRAVFPEGGRRTPHVTGERSSAEDAAMEALAKAHVRWRRIAPIRGGTAG